MHHDEFLVTGELVCPHHRKDVLVSTIQAAAVRRLIVRVLCTHFSVVRPKTKRAPRESDKAERRRHALQYHHARLTAVVATGTRGREAWLARKDAYAAIRVSRTTLNDSLHAHVEERPVKGQATKKLPM